MFRKAGASRTAPRGKSLISSVVVHVAAIFLLLQVADNDIAARNSINVARLKDEVIYYQLPPIRRQNLCRGSLRRGLVEDPAAARSQKRIPSQGALRFTATSR